MTARLIDGVATSRAIRAALTAKVGELRARSGSTPGLAVVLVGDNPASEIYVLNKVKQTEEVGMRSLEYRLPASTSEAALVHLIDKLNASPEVNGILVQLPLPPHIREAAVIKRIAREKDVDGFHPENIGLVSSGQDGIVPCTPMGAMMLIKQVVHKLVGKQALIIGRSNIVGKPMAQLLLSEHCTVTVAHSRTVDLPALARTADILIAAVGHPEMVKGNWIKPGACVIDVGINRVQKADGSGTRVVGDVAFDEAVEIAGAITPVPGGVGPMTIACLLVNTYRTALSASGLTQDEGEYDFI
ncbi:bifunctional 5,10-methylenetetrahydrofolate dehydrogenase/5,10-methenyltetrahydrofolate cyclohydrolase [Burkholderia cenocepacia]|uniref:bifunctional 5,10-methylenetetrahydrofolate dehydrogenase/5,10-methenyltetrahydrofolate cyclohydrolase n=1 Tax=Burkholderia cenocepacia TaxID=95486 RepID=UPI0026562332|nr:bifunctional methylenetetrahydrofolate dehydrogenase/methenyltetrahydrofolate cyclohydrolase FolD [Burkholderia cenocepacia]MDN7683146.1 bifunctional methylenetetrahydrofolate dehydrogenase/methenyltetrahydrofolate cyclohydrolase FolD [Burkholderia cenocepacia]